jgi:hypothetical protein
MHTNVGVCVAFISKLLNADAIELTKINLILSQSNPKKKGFVKVNRLFSNVAEIKGDKFKVCYEEQCLLDKAGIKKGDNFWMKVKIIS